MLVGLLAALGAGLLGLGWIGCRYFLGPRQALAVHKLASIAVKPVIADPSTACKAAPRPLIRFLNWSLWSAPLVVFATVGSVLALSGRFLLDPLDAMEEQRNGHIRTALNPEKLVPPPELPAALFSGTSVVGLETADRNWSRLDPQFMQVALRIFARMEARGYPMALLEGYRSPERQEMLANLGVHVTNARAFQSRHQYGLALDAAPMIGGKLAISERDPVAWEAYQALGEEAERAGLIWGGRWSMRDYGHIEVPKSNETPKSNKALMNTH